jgi:hypothetical protein
MAAMIGVAIGHTELCVACATVVSVCTVSVEEALCDPGMTLEGEKLPVAPVGSPSTVNPTALLNVPPLEVTTTLKDVDSPGKTVWAVGEPFTAKSAGDAPLPERATV